MDRDRTKNGDYYKKPTQYWFVNCAPEQNMFLEALEHVQTENIEDQSGKQGVNRAVHRSLMHPQYARRFIKAHILDLE